MHSELLCNAQTDVAAKRHGHCASRVRYGPVHAEPKMHSWPNPNVSGSPDQQRIATAAILSDSGNTFVLGIEPGEIWTDEPFSRAILGFVWAVRQPEARLHIVPKVGFLCSGGPQQRVKIFIRNQPPDVE